MNLSINYCPVAKSKFSAEKGFDPQILKLELVPSLQATALPEGLLEIKGVNLCSDVQSFPHVPKCISQYLKCYVVDSFAAF